MSVIVVRDRTENKLYFAGNLLWALNSLPIETYIQGKGYNSSFLSHFEKLNYINHPHDDEDFLYIDIIDQPEQIHDNALFFPILNKNQVGEYNKLRNDKKSKALLPPLKNTAKNLNCGNESWLTDVLLRKSGKKDLLNSNYLISAGPTRERFDPVRFLSNRSSGKMGIALARAAFIRGANVTLVLGPTTEYVPDYLNIKRVESAAEMAQTINNNFDKTDVYIGAAAIADYTPQDVKQEKIKKNNGGFYPLFKRTRDVLLSLKEQKKDQLLIGFSVETTDFYENSFKKLQNKGLDLIIANNPHEKGAAFAGNTNKVSILHKDGKIDKLPLLSKFEVANIILDEILKLRKLKQ